ncbi:MAG TPA: nucleotidyltransferase substrate binding protein [Chitinophagaceae bacterium]|nr:nucleotidyltransferase substrate binding protein [Chitinophagaceae bacterium]
MSKEERWKERFENFSKALLQLDTALRQKKFSLLEQDGVIKRFEFTVELAWKTLQDILNERGYNITGPKPVIKQAFKDNIIKDGQDWIDMLEDRNKSAHLYDESKASDIFRNIQLHYFRLLADFKNNTLKQINE